MLNSRTFSDYKIFIQYVVKLAALLVELFLLARDPYLYQTVFHYVNNITFHHRYRFISFFGSYSDLSFYIVVYITL